jgi:hypothetical protein
LIVVFYLGDFLSINRGHAIISLFVETRVPSKVGERAYSQGQLRLGKIHLIDLASGERVSESHAVGGDLVEAMNINRSLLSLGMF